MSKLSYPGQLNSKQFAINADYCYKQGSMTPPKAKQGEGMNLKLGFSTGCLHRAQLHIREKLAIIQKMGCRAVELGYVRLKDFNSGELETITTENLHDFDHVSLHAPKFDYGNNDGTIGIFERIRKLNRVRKLDLVVFHPDTIVDLDVFTRADFNVALENTDNRKEFCRRPEELERLLAGNNFGFVLDVNHVYSNDASMRMAAEFYKKLGGRISEVHLSGYRGYHEPLFETKQVEIVQSIIDFGVPIIVEGELTPENIQSEQEYILGIIGGLEQ